jgi:hypothetical protein
MYLVSVYNTVKLCLSECFSCIASEFLVILRSVWDALSIAIVFWFEALIFSDLLTCVSLCKSTKRVNNTWWRQYYFFLHIILKWLENNVLYSF